jgi:predicted RNA-binding protein YlxR (DUF448 family)
LSEPVRTCVACRTRLPQRALVRLRRRSDGVVVPAMGRRTRGRSAYLCPARACFEQALRRRALERALGRPMGHSDSPTDTDKKVDEAREPTLDAPPSEPLAPTAKGHRSRPHRARVPTLEVLWPSVVAALDQELQNMQRTGDIGHHGPRYDAISTLRRGLSEPGRSA